ncbi:MAG: hypothetical protein GY788_16145 [bacterium]|nr:hypothetical protein [bacterium]
MFGTVLEEPELEFGGGGRHIDPRYGITNFGPLDAGSPGAPERIRVGIVGAAPAIEGIRDWLGRAREPLPAKQPRYPKQRTLFPAFPGFDQDHTFRSLLVLDERCMRPIPHRVFTRVAPLHPKDAVRLAVDAYMQEIDWLTEDDRCDVIVCARPESVDVGASSAVDDDLGEEITSAEDREQRTRAALPDFHDQLKAAALRHATPLQIMRPETWEDRTKPPKGVRRRRVQGVSTRAWNLHTALYYKARGIPWRLVRSYADTTTCYLGISFFRSADGNTLHTSVAQLFNERGEGVVVRGGPAAVLKEDRQPHLSEDDAHDLLNEAAAAYRREHGTLPARLVVHKTSRFTGAERSGLAAACSGRGVDQLEEIWVTDRDPARLYRSADHPPLRGTAVALADDRFALYTRGSIEFYGTYPGMYVPAPLGLRPTERHHRMEEIAAETLALTKLNWNHSQLDGYLPITLHAAAKVKAILRWLPEGETPARRYANYM